MENNYSKGQVFSLVFLRVLIGWHLLYEGLVKIYDSGWSAKPYLEGSIGPFASIFHSMAGNESILRIVDLLNIWGLILIGLCLFIGLFSKPCKILAIILISFYYIAYPSFASLGINSNIEGSYWIVNKNLIEMAALLVLLFFPTSRIYGMDRFFLRKNRQKKLKT